MSTKDYIKLASAIGKAFKEVRNEDQMDGAMIVVNKLCLCLLEDNPKFKGPTFRNAIIKAAQ
jgi:hypothetical protein